MSTANTTHPGAAATRPNAEKVVIPVTGMTCAACQGRVQRTLSRTPGVVDASVNLMMGNATVSYDPDAITPDALVATIRKTGYGAELPPPDRTASDEQAEKVGARVPLGRIGRPEDIAGATLYLCGKAGAWVTGAILPMDSGASAI